MQYLSQLKIITVKSFSFNVKLYRFIISHNFNEVKTVVVGPACHKFIKHSGCKGKSFEIKWFINTWSEIEGISIKTVIGYKFKQNDKTWKISWRTHGRELKTLSLTQQIETSTTLNFYQPWHLNLILSLILSMMQQ